MTLKIFHDRIEAGEQLGGALRRYKGTKPIVLGIPRGGVAVAYQVAQALHSKFSIMVVRKLPFPDNHEAGFGAIAEDGAIYLIPYVGQSISQVVMDRTIQQQQEEVTRRIKALRNGQPLPDLQNHHVIIVDDGIAMGSTTQAAVMCCRNSGASRVTVAAPVASPDVLPALNTSADEVAVLLIPRFFRAVAQFYEEWYDVSDQEVVQIMTKASNAGMLAEAAPPRIADKSRMARRNVAPGTGAPCIS